MHILYLKLFFVFLILQDDVQSVNDTGNVTQNCQQDVDPEINCTSSLQEYTDWWNKDGKEDLDDITEEWKFRISNLDCIYSTDLHRTYLQVKGILINFLTSEGDQIG